MKIKLTALFVIISVFLTACTSAPESSSDTANTSFSATAQTTFEIPELVLSESKSAPLIWKISDDDSSVYMMGTIHAGNESTSDYMDYVMDVYNACPAIAVECNTVAFMQDAEAMAAASQKLLLNDGTHTKDHIDEDIYTDVVTLLVKHNLYSLSYDYYIPFMWINQLSLLAVQYAGLDGACGVDTYFINKAYEDGKDILEVESVELQYDVFTKISDEYCNLAFRHALEDDYLEYSVESLQQLYKAWHDGDNELLEKVANEESEFDSKADKLVYEEYNKILATDRNITMANAAESYLNGSSDVFMMVGALHYVGDDGIIGLLENDGYKVEQIKP